jgi:ABC-type ATPase involved in cell division
MDDLAMLQDEEIQNYRRNIGIIFQDDKLISSLSVKDNIVYPLRLAGASENLIKAKYKALLEKLALEDNSHFTYKTIS